MQNPYQTLGVSPGATADEIKRAYRKLASQHHPDKGGDKNRFQEIQGAYDAITNPKSAAHDTGPGFPHGGFNFDHIFDVFGTRFQQGHPRMQQQARMSLWITLRDVAQGGRRTISVGTAQGTQTVDIEIPLGINDGDAVQYPGIGPAGMDLIVSFRIHPDAEWSRQDLNLVTERTVPIWTLMLGGEIQVRDLLNTTLDVSIPSDTQPGTLIRLKSRGLRSRAGTTGDLLIRLQAMIPKQVDADVMDQIRDKYQK